jgi:hypothetical protein
VCFQTNTPPYRKIEYHPQTLNVAVAHEQRTPRTDHRPTMQSPRRREFVHPNNDERLHQSWRERLRRITPPRGIREPMGLVTDLINAALRSNRRGGSVRGIGICDPIKNKSMDDPVHHYAMAVHEYMKFISR